MSRRALGIGWASLAAAGLGASAATVSWTEDAGFRWRTLDEVEVPKTGFSRLDPSATGVTFVNVLDEAAGAANRVLWNGAGVAVGDMDQDGLPDLFFCGLSGTNALYRNRGGWRFEDVTAAAGLGARLPETRGATFADINGDGRQDLLVSVNGGGVRCFVNQGGGRFRDDTVRAGTGGPRGSTTLAVADVDGNGTPDLYVANYRPEDVRDRGRVQFTLVNGRPMLRGTETNRFILRSGKLEECGQPDQLFLNDGTGRFTEVPWTGGVFRDEEGAALPEAPLDWGLTASFRDVNGDGAPDLYVCNDYWTPDRFWLNDGKGAFRAIDRLAVRKFPSSSMGVDFADIDRDGDVDFFVVDMLSRDRTLRKRQLMAQMPGVTEAGRGGEPIQVPRNTLFLNRGDASFSEVAYQLGLEATDWSWSPQFLDVDLDGYEDLLVAAGHFRDVQDFDAEREIQSRQRSWNGIASETERQRAFTRELMEHYRLYPLLQLPVGGFRNVGGVRFVEETAAWGLAQKGVYHGMALGDLDGNGTLDLVVNGLNGGVGLYRNEGGQPRVAVRLVGRAPNTQAIGAHVSLHGGPVAKQSAEWVCGGRYLSGSEMLAVFAAGTEAGSLRLEVRWRGGGRTEVEGVRAGRLYEIREPATQAREEVGVEHSKVGSAFFDDVSASLGHRHHETPYDDQERQPLVPWRLSQGGPGILWFDVNADGADDLIIGAGRGSELGVYLGDGKGAFQAWRRSVVKVPDDVQGMVGWVDAEGARGVLLGYSGYEAPGSGGVVAQMWNDGEWKQQAVTAEPMSVGALALGDPAGDGKWALFVGGGVVPGQYPKGAPSQLYRWEGGIWRRDVRNGVLLENLGMVQGAIWTDLDADGFAELVLACAWGPVRVFQYRGNRLMEVTARMGLAALVGWWRGVTTGDLNGDGRLDLIVSNWGANSPYRASPDRPLACFYGEWAQPGVTEVLEAESVNGTWVPRAQLGTLLQSMPFLAERFPSHRAYSEATVDAVLGDRAVLAQKVTVNHLVSTVFLSGDPGYRPMPLPFEAQVAPGFGVATGDLDGDGFVDVVESQNFFPIRSEAGPLDAGLGLWLRGDGQGGLRSVPAIRSGIRVWGQQRGLALGDFDGDGRIDLAITQNGAETKLFRNRLGRPGVRVRLEGPAWNPCGWGAVVRPRRAGVLGAAREVRAGGGYFSQDSAVTVLGGVPQVEAVWVRWPGGMTQEVAVAPGVSEVVIRAPR